MTLKDEIVMELVKSIDKLTHAVLNNTNESKAHNARIEKLIDKLDNNATTDDIIKCTETVTHEFKEVTKSWQTAWKILIVIAAMLIPAMVAVVKIIK